MQKPMVSESGANVRKNLLDLDWRFEPLRPNERGASILPAVISPTHRPPFVHEDVQKKDKTFSTFFFKIKFNSKVKINILDSCNKESTLPSRCFLQYAAYPPNLGQARY